MPRFEQPAPVLRTERLVLRPLCAEDTPAIQKQFERYDVVRFLNATVPWPYPPDGAQFYLQQVLGPAVEAGQERAWAITLDGELIGSILVCAEGDESRGFWLNPDFWGRGFMAEASNRVTDYIMGELCWPVLITGNAVDNVASSRIKQKQGFVLNATFDKEFVGGRMPYHQWKLTRQAWLEHAQKSEAKST